MLKLLQGLQKSVEGFVIPLVMAVGGLLLFIVILYVIIVVLHVKQRRKLEKTRAQWRDVLQNKPHEISLNTSTNNRRLDAVYRDELVRELRLSDLEQDRLVEIYRTNGGYEKDISQLSSKSWWERAGALARLKVVPDQPLKIDLPSLIHDDSHEVRLVALDYVAKTGKLPDVDPIKLFESFSPNLDSFLVIKLLSTKPGLDFIDPLCNAQSARLRRCGATLLGQPGKSEFLATLKSLAGDDDPTTRKRTAEAIGRTDEKESLEVLEKTAKDEIPSVRRATAGSLGKLSFDDALHLLETLSYDNHFSVRLKAFESLTNFGEKGRKIVSDHFSEEPELAREALFESYQR